MVRMITAFGPMGQLCPRTNIAKFGAFHRFSADFPPRKLFGRMAIFGSLSPLAAAAIALLTISNDASATERASQDDPCAGQTQREIALVKGFVRAKASRKLSCADRDAAQAAYHEAFETGAVGDTTYWHNASNASRRGAVRASHWYMGAYGTKCRAYIETINITGQDESASGFACRDADGTWTITQ
jgi:surface antigen